jgi:hypothetical protein
MMQDSPRLSPRKEDFGQRLTEAIRDNPIPAALVGMGVLWLFMGGNRTTISQITEDSAGALANDGSLARKMGSQLADAGKKTGEALLDAGSSAASAATDAAAEVMTGTTEAVSNAAGAMHRGGTQLVNTIQRDLSDLFERQPLAVGAIGLVMGAAIGTAFSTTQVEADAFGETSHTLKKEAEELVSAGLNTAREVGAGLTGTTTRKAK